MDKRRPKSLIIILPQCSGVQFSSLRWLLQLDEVSKCPTLYFPIILVGRLHHGRSLKTTVETLWPRSCLSLMFQLCVLWLSGSKPPSFFLTPKWISTSSGQQMVDRLFIGYPAWGVGFPWTCDDIWIWTKPLDRHASLTFGWSSKCSFRLVFPLERRSRAVIESSY